MHPTGLDTSSPGPGNNRGRPALSATSKLFKLCIARSSQDELNFKSILLLPREDQSAHAMCHMRRSPLFVLSQPSPYGPKARQTPTSARCKALSNIHYRSDLTSRSQSSSLRSPAAAGAGAFPASSVPHHTRSGLAKLRRKGWRQRPRQPLQAHSHDATDRSKRGGPLLPRRCKAHACLGDCFRPAGRPPPCLLLCLRLRVSALQGHCSVRDQ